MDFTFVRSERSQQENQERAYIAASKRQDRDFRQRLESLQKASELHFARTGKRFEVTQAQVEHHGPMVELGDEERKGRESRRHMPYTLERPGSIRRGEGERHESLGPVSSQRGHLPTSLLHQPIKEPRLSLSTLSEGLEHTLTQSTIGGGELYTSPHAFHNTSQSLKIASSEDQVHVESTNDGKLDLGAMNTSDPPTIVVEEWQLHFTEFDGFGISDMQDYLDSHFSQSGLQDHFVARGIKTKPSSSEGGVTPQISEAVQHQEDDTQADDQVNPNIFDFIGRVEDVFSKHVGEIAGEDIDDAESVEE